MRACFPEGNTRRDAARALHLHVRAMNLRVGERYGSVGRLWQSCWPLEADDAVAAWLRERRISGVAATRRDLARALSRRGADPRLVIPIYDPWGELSALAAHRVCGDDEPETLLLGARQAEGMVFANPIARHVLAGVA